jgi:hypothetical protein
MDASQRNRQTARPHGAPVTPSIRARLEELRSRLGEVHRLERLAQIVDTNNTSGKPISDRIYDLLRANPDMTFSPAEIMECIHVREDRVEAVRKALQRLSSPERGAIQRIGHAEYRINLPPSEDPTR